MCAFALDITRQERKVLYSSDSADVSKERPISFILNQGEEAKSRKSLKEPYVLIDSLMSENRAKVVVFHKWFYYSVTRHYLIGSTEFISDIEIFTSYFFGT